MHISIKKVDEVILVDIDGKTVPGVVDYKIINSSAEGTRLNITLQIDGSITDFLTSTNS